MRAGHVPAVVSLGIRAVDTNLTSIEGPHRLKPLPLNLCHEDTRGGELQQGIRLRQRSFFSTIKINGLWFMSRPDWHYRMSPGSGAEITKIPDKCSRQSRSGSPLRRGTRRDQRAFCGIYPQADEFYDGVPFASRHGAGHGHLIAAQGPSTFCGFPDSLCLRNDAAELGWPDSVATSRTSRQKPVH